MNSALPLKLLMVNHLLMTASGSMSDWQRSMTEGDIRLANGESWEDIENDYRVNTINGTRKVAVKEFRKWTDNTVYYKIQRKLRRISKAHIAINKGLEMLREATCLKFEYRNRQKSYILFKWSKNSCSSLLGMQPRKQKIELYLECFDEFTVIHEVMHALGFDHEHTRPDRDRYVKLDEDNIIGGAKSQFKKHTFEAVELLGIEYDYGSVMHYSAFAFAKDEFKPTITPLEMTYPDGTPVKIGVDQFSDKDKLRINKYYGCVEPTTTLPVTIPVCAETKDIDSKRCKMIATRGGCNHAITKGRCPVTCNWRSAQPEPKQCSNRYSNVELCRNIPIAFGNCFGLCCKC